MHLHGSAGHPFTGREWDGRNQENSSFIETVIQLLTELSELSPLGGTSEVEHVFATDPLARSKPKKMLVFTGVPQRVYSGLHSHGKYGVAWSIGYVVEYRGEAIDTGHGRRE